MKKDRAKKREAERLYYWKTRERRLELSNARYKKNPKSFAVNNKRAALKRKYNLTLEEYETMFTLQNGRCAICESSEENRLLAVDHNHQTNTVRQLLCGNCNRALGLFKDSFNIVNKAAEYLAAHGGSN